MTILMPLGDENAASPIGSVENLRLGPDLRLAAAGDAAMPQRGRVLILVLVVIALVVVILVGTMLSVWPTAPARQRGVASINIDLPLPAVDPVALKAIDRETAKALNGELPTVPGIVEAAPPFELKGAEDDVYRARSCLAAAGIYEAGDDPDGERAVMQVVLNRLRHPAFPKTVCGVVFQGAERKTGCQFTFTCDGAIARRVPDAAWQRSLALASDALSGAVYPSVGRATHYHAEWVVPYWQPEMEKLVATHGHIFFRWRGFWGQAGAFRKAVPLAAEPLVAALATRDSRHGDSGDQSAITVSDTPAPVQSDGGVPAAALARKQEELAGARRYLTATVNDPSVVTAAQRGGILLVQFRPGLLPGRYAMAALRLCPVDQSCHVLGWTEPTAMPTALPAGLSAARGLMLLYVRAAGGNDRLLFNCRVAPQPDARRCLPDAEQDVLVLLNAAVRP